jgi:hypothetical protein
MIKAQDIVGAIWDMFKFVLLTLCGMFLFFWILFPPTGIFTILVITILERMDSRKSEEGRA